MSNSDARLRLVGDVLRQGTSAEWLTALEAEDVPCAPILSREQLIADPQVAENELLIEEEHPLAGRIRYARPAARFERTPAELRRPAPDSSPHILDIVDRIKPGVAAIVARHAPEGAPAVEHAAMKANVRASVDQLRHGSAIVEHLIATDGLVVTGAWYSLETGMVEFLDESLAR